MPYNVDLINFIGIFMAQKINHKFFRYSPYSTDADTFQITALQKAVNRVFTDVQKSVYLRRRKNVGQSV